MRINIKCMKNKKDWKEFLLFPWKIYKGNPYWVPPLISDVKERLDMNNYPFYEHAEREVFLAKKNGETVGRIVAIIDKNHNKFHNEKTGFFGFFECLDDPDVAASLIDEAKKWCKERGMNKLRGPASPSMNDECAFLLEGYDSSPTIMMPYNPEYYHSLMEHCGLKKAKDLVALFKRTEDGIPERFIKLIDRMKNKMKVKVRPFSLKHFDRDVQILKDIYNDSWEKNWGFVPMTDKEMDHTAKQIKLFADTDLVVIAEIDGSPVGLAITLPNVNEVLSKLNGRMGITGVIKYLYYKNKIKGVRSLIGGVKKEYRNTGIIAALFYETELTVGRKGYEWCELGWNLEDNRLINEFDMALGGKIYKKYRIYEMNI